MTDIRNAQGLGYAGHTHSDAYMRILSWEEHMTRRRDMSRLQRYRRAFEYYNGDNQPPGQYIQPLAINYLRVICENHAAYLWGEWDDGGSIINWALKPRSSKGDKQTMQKIEEWLYDLMSEHESILYTSGLNQSIFGDAIMLPRWDPYRELIYPESVLPEYFHARWSPHDINLLTEVVYSYPMSRHDADMEYGTRGDPAYGAQDSAYVRDFGIYWEHWTREDVAIYFDNIELDRKPNPYKISDLPGVIPYIHTPSVRAGGEFYGTGDIDNVLELQDELNRKMADAGDIISYSAHPIILVRNYFGRVADLPVGPDAIWDMGREGEAEYLSGSPPPVSIEDYINKTLEIIEDLSRMPAAAFGRSETAKASALAMAMEMMPVTSRVNWKRLHWKNSLIDYVYMAARLAEKNGALPFKRRDLNKYVISPVFAPILPRDRMALVNEQVQLVTNGLRSTRRSLEVLGENDPEYQLEEIMRDLKEKAQLGMDLNLGGKNARGPGGSPESGAEARQENNTETGGEKRDSDAISRGDG